jgi:hypothetical protein
MAFMSAPFPATALEGVEAAVEPHVKAATDRIYEDVMLSVQDYLRDNAEFNIGQQIATADREAAYARGKLVDMTADRDRMFAALTSLKPILDSAESNASGNPEWEFVSGRVNAARAAIAKVTGA